MAKLKIEIQIAIEIQTTSLEKRYLCVE